MKQICIAAFFLLTSFSSLFAQSRNNGDLPHFRVALQGGWSYRTAKVADLGSAELEDYAKGLKSGFHLGAEAAYFFTDNLGCGLKYAYFRTSNEVANVTVTTPDNQVRTGVMKDAINIHYIAPTFNARYLLADKLFFLGGVSLGYLRYIDNAVLVSPMTLTGGTLGAGLDLGLDYMITQHFGIGANVGFIGGVLNSYTLDNGTNQTEVRLEEGQKESLARLDLSVGVRWAF